RILRARGWPTRMHRCRLVYSRSPGESSLFLLSPEAGDNKQIQEGFNVRKVPRIAAAVTFLYFQNIHRCQEINACLDVRFDKIGVQDERWPSRLGLDRQTLAVY